MNVLNRFPRLGAVAVVLVGLGCGSSARGELWDMAQEKLAVHRFSTLITAQDVRDRLKDDAGIDTAIDWCRRTAVTKVYLETFRDGYQAEGAALERVRDRFRKAAIEVAGCVTPTHVGKRSTGWSPISCYTDTATQERVGEIFRFVASLFDEIMIDDFWFTDCECAECEAGRRARRVAIGDHVYPVAGDTWEDYRCELMVRLSQERVLGPAQGVNPNVRMIIKYPQWYDRFHERGYEVVRQTADFDRIWVGTETRDYQDARWGGTVQYEAYFIMRWLGGIGGEKCGGGWYDWLGTTEQTYLEQARQTILGGARESVLFCYGGLQGSTGPKNIEALRRHIPELFKLAGEVEKRKVVGLAAYKPANSHPGNEARVFDFVGMLGLPLVPCHEFPADAPAAFFSVHALKDGALVERLRRYVATGRPVLVTDGLAAVLKGKVDWDRPNVEVLEARGDPKTLIELEQPVLDRLRARLLKPFRLDLGSPNKVALCLFEDGSWVVSNFNDERVEITVDGVDLSVEARGWKMGPRELGAR
jgi:hypothetical protein